MKKSLIILFNILCISISANSQQLENVPSGLKEQLDRAGVIGSPTVTELHASYEALMAETDPGLDREKIKAQRWFHYEFPKYTITNGNDYSLTEYSDASKAIYTSSLNCGESDPADWQADGPAYMPDWLGKQSGGRVDAIYNHPNDLSHYVVGTYTSGIFVSEDAGANWNCVTDGLNFPVLGVQQMIVDPNNPDYLLAITGPYKIEGGLIYSADAGVTWNEVTQNLPQFNWIDYHPTIPDLLFAATDDAVNGIMYSSDNGITWSSLGLPPIGVYDNAINTMSKLIALDDKLFFRSNNKWGPGASIYRVGLTITGTVSATWPTSNDNALFGANSLDFVDFSNKVGSTFYIQVRNPTTATFRSTDFGNAFAQLIVNIPSGGNNTNELIASLNDPNILYQGGIYNMRRYNLTTGVFEIIYGLNGNNGYHDDNRTSQIINVGGADRIIMGNDGGPALIVDGLIAFPKIQSLLGNLSINMIHAFDVHEKTGRVAYAFQDHKMRYRDPGNTFSGPFIHEGSSAMVQQYYPDNIVGDNAYNGIKDNTENGHPIVSGTFGQAYECRLGGYFVKYRHFPDRFARGMHKSSGFPTGKVGLGRGVDDQERSTILSSVTIGAVAICERRPEFIYAAENQGGNSPNKFYRSTDDGATWQNMLTSTVVLDGNAGSPVNLSNNLVWNSIRAIAVDHHDPTLVYCGIGGTHITWPNGITDERFRVIRSFDGGDTFVDYSEGLPALPVERLLSIDSDDDLIFCATSVGIYYRTNTMNQWECFSEGLPKAEITGLQYSYCNNILYASTYGRGMWKTEVNLNVSSDYTQEIVTNTIWNTDRTLTENLVIKQGYSLTIYGDVYVESGKKIIVEAGAKLIIDGARLTNFCGDYWQGIEVQGNEALSQTSVNQGYLITRNDAIIEYAINAITVVGRNQNGSYNWNQTGGIVNCNKTHFINNRRGVQYLTYHHYTGGGVEMMNLGRFANCTFTWDDDYTLTSTPYGMTMLDINGVQIVGSDFVDNRTNVDVARRARGIFSINAGYKVRGDYTGPGTSYPPNFPQHICFDETDYDVGHFTDLYSGIHAMHSVSLYPITVDHNMFVNNSYGVLLDAVDNAVVTRNHFDFNNLHPIDMTSMYELTLRECNGYKVEGNKFYKNDPWGAAGTLVINSGPQANEIYKNWYDGVNVGNWAYGFNSNDLSSTALATGLQWRCNTNDNGYLDLLDYVPSYDPALDGEGVRLLQGSLGEAAGNKFSQNIVLGQSIPDAHIYHVDQDLMGYFHTTDPVEIPVVIVGNVTTMIGGDNTCPSTFTSSMLVSRSRLIPELEYPILESRVQDIDQQLVVKRAELSVLLSNGDATSLHDLVAGLSNQNKNQVKSSLLQAGPYLSQSLLEELGQKQPSLFPHSWYKQIIDANIEVARSNEFMESLLTKAYPMPTGMYDQINTDRYVTFTARGEKELAILDLTDEREVLLNLFIADEMADEDNVDWNSVKQLIISRDHIECKRQLVDLHLSKENIADCNIELDLIELQLASYDMDRVRQELQDFVFFKRYLLSITENTGLVKELDADEILQLDYMANNFQGKAARQARSILCFYVGKCDEVDAEIPDVTQEVYRAPSNGSIMTDLDRTLEIVPNPNGGLFELGVPEDCSINTISIVDVNGKIIGFQLLSQEGNKSKIRLEGPQNGLHFILVHCVDGSSYTNRVLVTK